MTRILIASTPVYGHFVPVRSIALHLVKIGHAVTFLTGEQFRSAVEETGATFVPLTGKANYDLNYPEKFFPERATLPAGFPQLEYDMLHVFADPIPDQYASIARLLEEMGEETVIVQDSWFFGTWPFQLGAPGPRPKAVVSIGITVLPLTSIDTAPFGPGLPPDSSPAGRARNRELNDKTKNELFAPLQSHLVHLLESVGAKEPAPFYFDGMVTVPDLYLHLGIEGFEYPRSDAPASIHYVGTLPVNSGEARPLPNWWGEVSTAETVVVVSQGTIANHDFSELIEPTMEALAGLDALVIALTGRPAELANVPDNVRTAEFVPFDLLLPHTDVLVSNAGYGGVQLALSHGVPMVLAGATEDKPEVSAHAAWAGAAVNLATNRPEPAELRKAVETVLAESHYRDNAQRLQAEYAAHDAAAEITAVIEKLLT
jgi:UDP:flavonoid glycosyltransferase YjiC (YdhE family)